MKANVTRNIVANIREKGKRFFPPFLSLFLTPNIYETILGDERNHRQFLVLISDLASDLTD